MGLFNNEQNETNDSENVDSSEISEKDDAASVDDSEADLVYVPLAEGEEPPAPLYAEEPEEEPVDDLNVPEWIDAEPEPEPEPESDEEGESEEGEENAEGADTAPDSNSAPDSTSVILSDGEGSSKDTTEAVDTVSTTSVIQGDSEGSADSEEAQEETPALSEYAVAMQGYAAATQGFTSSESDEASATSEDDSQKDSEASSEGTETETTTSESDKADDATETVTPLAVASVAAATELDTVEEATDQSEEEQAKPEKLGFFARRKAKKQAAMGAHAAQGQHTATPPSEASYGDFVNGTFAEIPQKKSHHGLKIFSITVGAFAAVVLAVYVGGILFFSSHFLPNTYLCGHDVSMRSDNEAALLLQSDTENYVIQVVGDGFSYVASGSDIGLSLDSNAVVAAMHRAMPAWEWPVLIFQPLHDGTEFANVTFEHGVAEEPLAKAIDQFNKDATPPTNASIFYDEKQHRFIVKEDALGTRIDPSYTVAAFVEAITKLQPSLVITDEFLEQPTVLRSDERLIESAKLASGLTSADLNLVLNGKTVRNITGADLSRFVVIDDQFGVTFDEKAMKKWCKAIANEFNTVGSARTYTRADGKVVFVDGGDYGWEVDADALKNSLIEGIKAGEKADVVIPLTTEAEVFTAAGEPDWGKRYIDVDISEQHVRFYDSTGALFWETDCITGSPDGKHNTVQGVWSINKKESPSTLKGYENGKKIYETKVTFWMPFEGNSIGFHDATWQPSFGGTMYANGYGSHGCVNLSYDAAKELYGLITEGDVVIVHD